MTKEWWTYYEREGPAKIMSTPKRKHSLMILTLFSEMIHSGGIHPIFREHKIEIVRVRMLPDMRNVHIFWSITGNPQIDREIDEKLRNEAGWEIRRQMAQLQVRP